ncbi:hypothetical protein [Dictyobacter kobayashii]|uniref:Glycosyltransferase RgtA/B/C/D-like domain-containing protein n=1 Tax=Dictyobacter kobayashii TaxID=2014872 RepID=A0A402AWB4_9CHLR|nr:hypothetical protein [Dictyobacter kobayashii]GCE23388.1 hypothetical protein KDK_71880 [Dictyobacter kobayashii]
MAQNKLDTPEYKYMQQRSIVRRPDTFPFLLLLATLVVIVIADLTFSSRHFWLYTVIYNHLHPVKHSIIPGAVGEAMPLNLIKSLPLAQAFTGLFTIIFILYFFSLRLLPAKVGHRFIIGSTIVLGIGYILLPIVTSQDVFSYIAYARMAVFYHLNPMVVPPTAIKPDFVYGFLYWIHQPSVYGPTWLAITAGLQLLATAIGFKYVLSMELLLRIFGLLMHLGSTQLVWLLTGRLQKLKSGVDNSTWQKRRVCSTLAFAWNPFLLLEACVNAHNDATILFLLLFALWFLFPRTESSRVPFLVAITLLALIACLKISYIVLMPGILLFLLLQAPEVRSLGRRLFDVGVALLLYIGLIVAIHAPFWDHGALLKVFAMTPSASRNINSVYELLVHAYAQIRGIPLAHGIDRGSQLEILSHILSTGLFVFVYVATCVRSFLRPQYINTWPALVAWLAFTWLLYCVIGSPWYWPWYAIILFGLFALLEVTQEEAPSGRTPVRLVFGAWDVTLFSRCLSVSMVGLYALWIFYNLLPNLQPTYLTSLWVWGIPFLIIGISYARGRLKQKTLYAEPSL